MIKVKALIAALQKYDPDALVVEYGGEDYGDELIFASLPEAYDQAYVLNTETGYAGLYKNVVIL